MGFKTMLPTAAILVCAFSGQAWAGPVLVSCGSGQHAFVRDTYVHGQAVTRVECVRSYTVHPTGYRAFDGARYRNVRRHRSWGKTALIIGGGAGTGAGIGEIVHGRRGAAVGAALGGGLASLYEGAHRR